MRIDPAGWPFILGGLVLGVIALSIINPFVGVALLSVTAFFLFFFRDPDRVAIVPESAVVSPADGRVMVAGVPTVQAFSARDWRQISIFLSPMDVHVNRMPVSGRVTHVEYHPGRFLPAYKRDAGDLNEFTEVHVQHGATTVVVRQIVGILARRIVCRTREGAVVKAGERFGVMKFGSRMDIFIPASSTVHAAVGDKVVGGVTVLATLPDDPGGGPTAPLRT
jgi:phosphatidylserine decarboxylase